MPLSNQDDTHLLIRCPSCGQRFKVADDLRGRSVECGGCEHRFQINDEVIVRGRKFYPGERRDSTLNRFQRVPLAIAPDSNRFKAMQYAEAPDLTVFEPVSPQRIMAGSMGLMGMVMMALLLMFGASRGGTLDGMPLLNRLLIAGFTGLLGGVLLVYANPRARLKAGLWSMLFAGGLLALPFYFREGSVPLSELTEDGITVGRMAEQEQVESEKIIALRNRIGTDPLVAEIERLAQDGSEQQAMGLWLKGLREHNRFLVRDYILRVTGANPQTHYYARGGGEFLMVVTGITQTLEEMSRVASALGEVRNIYPEISVVEIQINNENFAEAPVAQLTDKQNPGFYELNKKELDSIDLQRVLHAVQRLADVEPNIYRDDITRKLLGLLSAPGVEFKGDICRALRVWAGKPGPAGEAALKEARILLERKAEVPQEMVALMVQEKIPGVVPVLDALWVKDPTAWEVLYGEVGAPAELALLRRFPTTEGRLRHSAVRLLERVGGTDCLPLLDAATSGADSEMKIMLEKAKAAIRSRSGG